MESKKIKLIVIGFYFAFFALLLAIINEAANLEFNYWVISGAALFVSFFIFIYSQNKYR